MSIHNSTPYPRELKNMYKKDLNKYIHESQIGNNANVPSTGKFENKFW